ncbi:MAG TPA: hypothetical protein VFI73_09575 [Candidatus Nitrosopolaris sp.]|nr:hypothetical protein [Candidatus Nitrosopolaris sp.]
MGAIIGLATMLLIPNIASHSVRATTLAFSSKDGSESSSFTTFDSCSVPGGASSTPIGGLAESAAKSICSSTSASHGTESVF